MSTNLTLWIRSHRGGLTASEKISTIVPFLPSGREWVSNPRSSDSKIVEPTEKVSLRCSCHWVCLLTPKTEVNIFTHAPSFSCNIENHGSSQATGIEQGGQQEPPPNRNAHLCARSRWQKEPIRHTPKIPHALQEEWPWSAYKYMSLGLNKLHHYFYILRGVHVKGTRGMLCYLSCRQYMPRSHAVSVSSAQANWPAPRPLNERGVPVPNILFSYCLMIKIAPAGRTAVNKNRKQPPD